jgi:hypothetical protein
MNGAVRPDTGLVLAAVDQISARDGGATRESVRAQLGGSLELDVVGELLEDLTRRGLLEHVDAVAAPGLPRLGFRPVRPATRSGA